ncbi:MAG: septum formation initiator family protein [Prevotella sp.]
MKKMTWASELLRRSRFLKYVVVMAGGVALVGFVGDSSVWSHMRNKQKISELQSEIDLYRGEYERDMTKLRRLDSDPNAIVEIARERYFMKKEDEDIFVLSDDAPSTIIENDETTE